MSDSSLSQDSVYENSTPLSNFIGLKKVLSDQKLKLKDSPSSESPLLGRSSSGGRLDDVGSPLRKKGYSKFKSSSTPVGNRTSLSAFSTWEVPPSLQKSQARQQHTCIVIGNLVVIYGGCTNTKAEPTHTTLSYNLGMTKQSTLNSKLI